MNHVRSEYHDHLAQRVAAVRDGYAHTGSALRELVGDLFDEVEAMDAQIAEYEKHIAPDVVVWAGKLVSR